jgi:hypothetical protein
MDFCEELLKEKWRFREEDYKPDRSERGVNLRRLQAGIPHRDGFFP